jgi:hypothetical protein
MAMDSRIFAGSTRNTRHSRHNEYSMCKKRHCEAATFCQSQNLLLGPGGENAHALMKVMIAVEERVGCLHQRQMASCAVDKCHTRPPLAMPGGQANGCGC